MARGRKAPRRGITPRRKMARGRKSTGIKKYPHGGMHNGCGGPGQMPCGGQMGGYRKGGRTKPVARGMAMGGRLPDHGVQPPSCGGSCGYGATESQNWGSQYACNPGCECVGENWWGGNGTCVDSLLVGNRSNVVRNQNNSNGRQQMPMRRQQMARGGGVRKFPHGGSHGGVNNSCPAGHTRAADGSCIQG